MQVGLSDEAVARYVDEMTVSITDVTDVAHRSRDLLCAGDQTNATALLPPEHPYPVPPRINAVIEAAAAGED